MVLYISDSGTLYSYKNGWLLENGRPILCVLNNLCNRLLCRVRVLSRLLRLEPRCATMLNEDVMLIAFRHQIIVVSLSLQKVIKTLPAKSGFSHPLNFCSLKQNGLKMVYWGDYGDNIQQDPVSIYCMKDNLEVDIVYVFKAGMIKHVHNIIFDKWRNRFFIFTGDFGDAVGMYTANVDFQIITPYLIGNEKYRAVQGFVTENGLCWATDAVMSDNYIYYQDFQTKTETKLFALNGSVIYGMEVNNGLLISTTVEPYPSSSSKLKTLFDRRLGPGIKSKDVIVLFIDNNRKVSEIKKFRKDFWIMRLFQYGQILFPFYENKNQQTVYVNPMAVKNYDGKELKINII